MHTKEIREELETLIEIILKDENLIIIEEITNPNAHGHEVGRPIEDWMLDHLETADWNVDPYLSNKFVSKFLEQIGKNEQKIEEQLKNTWWHPNSSLYDNLLVTQKQIKAFLDGKEIERWQQAGADIVLFFGKNIVSDSNKVVLINTKGHNTERKSRPPNIISAQRLMGFFKQALQNDNLEDVNYWFLGVNFKVEKVAEVQSMHLKDLFLLDLDKLPQINFDAAIQMQWNVHDMVEVEQRREEFVRNFADKFSKSWDRHVERKERKFKELAKTVKKLASK